MKIFKALGNETRLAIFNYIRGPEYDCASGGRLGCEIETTERTVCVSHVARRFGSMGQAAISQHLKHLHEAGLLDRHKAGSWVYYTISTSTVSVIRQFFAAAEAPPLVAFATPEKRDQSIEEEKNHTRKRHAAAVVLNPQ